MAHRVRARVAEVTSQGDGPVSQKVTTSNASSVPANGVSHGEYAPDMPRSHDERPSLRESGLDWARITRAWVVPALVLVESFLAFRLGFLLVSADPANGFVNFVYDITRPLVSPFEGVIKSSNLGDSGVFEPSILVAMLVYLVAALLLTSLANAIAATIDETRRAYALRENEVSQEVGPARS